jgi:RNA polymerase sigma factor (sigma-70 family)
MHNNDAVLLPYLQATGAGAQEQAQLDLLQLHATPLIRRVLLQRLGFYVDQRGDNAHPAEAADLYQASLLQLIKKLNELHAHPAQHAISNFRSYVLSVAVNTCNAYLREQAPRRSGLRHNLRDLLTRHARFAVWSNNSQWWCGFVEWQTAAPAAKLEWSATATAELLAELRQAGWSKPSQQRFPMAKLLQEIFTRVGQPLEFETLLALVAEIQNQPELQLVSWEETSESATPALIVPTAAADLRLHEEDRLRLVWDELLRMPPEQRTSFYLLFPGNADEHFFLLLLRYRIVSLAGLATGLGLRVEELLARWPTLPLNHAAAAKLLGTTPPNLSKWYHRALKRLLARLAKN